jgi:hypothetical protein
MQSSIVFQSLPGPIPPETLPAFRKDARGSNDGLAEKNFHPAS